MKSGRLKSAATLHCVPGCVVLWFLSDGELIINSSGSSETRFVDVANRLFLVSDIKDVDGRRWLP